MKVRSLFIFLYICLSASVFSQTTDDGIKGNVSYISSQNIYVKFASTEGIRVGDTLFVSNNNVLSPVLVVKSMSSISCVGSPIAVNSLLVSTQITAKKRPEDKPKETVVPKSNEAISVNDKAVKDAGKKDKDNGTKARFDGRISVSSYTNASLSSYVSTNSNTVSTTTGSERLRYNLTFNASHISNSNLSAESNITFTHVLSFPGRATDWTGLGNALKIYSLGLKYDFNKTTNISFGRKIYNNMANIGAVDGFEVEKVSKNFTFGALIGSRPNDFTYGLDPTLIQYGGFVSHNIQKENGYMQTSLAFFNQMNNFKTDRRFAYFQHSNSLLKNLNFFCSFEVDLYGMKSGKDSAKVKTSLGNDSTVTWKTSTPANILDLTSTYLSLSYRPLKNLSMSLSYDARKNIYYYETYPRNKIDSTLDKETRQGFRFQTMYYPFKFLVWGGNAGYRFQPSDPKPSINAYTYLSCPQVPWINTYLTISATALSSTYMKNMTVYGISMSRDFFNGKMNLEAEYRLGNYTYNNAALPSTQNIASMSVFWRIAKKLTVSANFEATFENNNSLSTSNYGSLFVNLIKRF